MNALQWMAAIGAVENIGQLRKLVVQLMTEKSLAEGLCGQPGVPEAVNKAFERVGSHPIGRTKKTSEQQRKTDTVNISDRTPRPCRWYGCQRRREALEHAKTVSEQQESSGRSMPRSVGGKAKAALKIPPCKGRHSQCLQIEQLLEEMIKALATRTWIDGFEQQADDLLNPKGSAKPTPEHNGNGTKPTAKKPNRTTDRPVKREPATVPDDMKKDMPF